jgi:hypothetical protein
MKLIITLMAVLGAAAISGCSSPPKQTSQFCHTYKTVDVTDGKTVSSKTTVNCSDDPIDRITLAKTGVAKTCGEYSYWITLKGQPVERKAISCKKWDGTWEVVPTGSTF